MPPCRAKVTRIDVALTHPWTNEPFLNRAAAQEGRHEFDGMRPVAMTGGTARHSRITLNIRVALARCTGALHWRVALRSWLRGTQCLTFGPDLGVRTIGDAIRFPNALVTGSKFPQTERLAPDLQVVFEVLGAGSGRRDRIQKVREYAAVRSIRHHIIVESAGVGLLVLHRQSGDDAWTVPTLTGEDVLPAIGIEIPVAEFYESVDFDDTTAAGQLEFATVTRRSRASILCQCRISLLRLSGRDV
jgi:hypothetical protein